jgi:hypothetical protein
MKNVVLMNWAASVSLLGWIAYAFYYTYGG